MPYKQNKMNRAISNTRSFLLALLAYIVVVVFVFFKLIVFKEPAIRYTDLEDSFMDIELAEPSKQVMNEQKTVEKTLPTPVLESNTQELTQETTNKAVKTEDINQKATDFNALFGNVKDIQDEKTTKVQSSAKSTPKSSTPAPVASQLVKQLNDNLVVQKSNPAGDSTKSQRTGVYDKFLGAVTRIIEQRWRLYHPHQGNLKVVVKIFIDGNGNFGYTSVEKSYNTAFDEKVLDFLKDQSGKFIANPPKGELVNITMNLGDEVEAVQ